MFSKIRKWGEIRGLTNETNPHVQMYRLLEEVAELQKAITTKDQAEVEDAIGDIVVVLTQLSKSYGSDIEKYIQGAFGVIEKRKGFTKDGSFVRYRKLSPEEQYLCDLKQGNPGNDYYIDEPQPEDFIK